MRKKASTVQNTMNNIGRFRGQQSQTMERVIDKMSIKLSIITVALLHEALLTLSFVSRSVPE